jgi:Gpi18-like mannosyltransferase
VKFKIIKEKLAKIVFPVCLFFGWRAIILIYQIFFQHYIVTNYFSNTLYQRLFASWTTYWDAGHYTTIASFGYRYPQQAFFPLWPFIIKLLSMMGITTFLSSYILTFIFGLATFILFYLLAKSIMGKSGARLALLAFAVFPSTMFLITGYTESLFLALALLAFYLLEKGKYFSASLVSALATAVRLAGIAVSLATVFSVRKTYQKVIFPVVGAVGLVSYMLYLKIYFGNPLLFLQAQSAWCELSYRCALTFPLVPIISYGLGIWEGIYTPGLYYDFIDWVAAVIFIILLIRVYKDLKLPYFVYSFITVLLPLLSGSTVGMVRYVLVAFPVFFILPSFVRSKIIFIFLCILMFLLQLRFIAFFTSRLWVA